MISTMLFCSVKTTWKLYTDAQLPSLFLALLDMSKRRLRGSPVGPRVQRQIETRSFTIISLYISFFAANFRRTNTRVFIIVTRRIFGYRMLLRDAKFYHYNARYSDSAGTPPQTRYGSFQRSFIFRLALLWEEKE